MSLVSYIFVFQSDPWTVCSIMKASTIITPLEILKLTIFILDYMVAIALLYPVIYVYPLHSKVWVALLWEFRRVLFQTIHDKIFFLIISTLREKLFFLECCQPSATIILAEKNKKDYHQCKHIIERADNSKVSSTFPDLLSFHPQSTIPIASISSNKYQSLSLFGSTEPRHQGR